MTDIKAVADEALSQLFQSGKVQQMVEKQLETTIAEIIRDSLRKYSDFGKALEKAIEAQLPTAFDSLSLADYNAFILEAVGKRLQLLASEDWQADINRMLDEMFKPFQGELKVSKLCEMVKEHFTSDINCACDGDESFTFIIDTSRQVGGYYTIAFDEHQDRDMYRCKYMLQVNKEGEVYSAKIDDEDPKKKLFKGPYYNIERLLMALFYGKTRLVLDVESHDHLDTSLRDYD